jgi:hypothetical protein
MVEEVGELELGNELSEGKLQESGCLKNVEIHNVQIPGKDALAALI